MNYNIYQGHINLQNNLNNYKNQILNYFKSTYNDCFIPSFMNNKKDELNRNKHAGAHIAVSSFTPRENGFRDYNQTVYYYVTTSQVNIGNHPYFTLTKSVVENAQSNNRFMFITPNSLFVCDRDFVIEYKNKLNDIKHQCNTINKECFFIPVEDCEMIPFEAGNYYGFYNTNQWKPKSVGFYCGKAAGNRFNLVFPVGKKEFSSVHECFKWIESNKSLTYTKTERSLSREIKNKGEVVFAEGVAKVEWICGKLERNTSYIKRTILTEEQEKNLKEWKKFEEETIKELEASSPVKEITKDNSVTQNVSDVIIESKYINNNNNNNNNNNKYSIITSDTSETEDVPQIVLDNNVEWEDFSNNKYICNFLKRRPKISDYIAFRKGQLNLYKEVI